MLAFCASLMDAARTPNFALLPHVVGRNMVLGNILVEFMLGMSITCCLSPYPDLLLPNVNAISGKSCPNTL